MNKKSHTCEAPRTMTPDEIALYKSKGIVGNSAMRAHAMHKLGDLLNSALFTHEVISLHRDAPHNLSNTFPEMCGMSYLYDDFVDKGLTYNSSYSYTQNHFALGAIRRFGASINDASSLNIATLEPVVRYAKTRLFNIVSRVPHSELQCSISIGRSAKGSLPITTMLISASRMLKLGNYCLTVMPPIGLQNNINLPIRRHLSGRLCVLDIEKSFAVEYKGALIQGASMWPLITCVRQEVFGIPDAAQIQSFVDTFLTMWEQDCDTMLRDKSGAIMRKAMHTIRHGALQHAKYLHARPKLRKDEIVADAMRTIMGDANRDKFDAHIVIKSTHH